MKNCFLKKTVLYIRIVFRSKNDRVKKLTPEFLASLGRWSASALVTLLWLTPVMILARIARQISTKLLKGWCRIQLRIFGIEVKVTDRNRGQYHSPPYLYLILNQTSLSETFIINFILPTDFKVFMNIGFAFLPLIGWLYWILGGVVVIRQWPRQSRRAMEKAARLLRAGDSFYMSIEGRRSPDGKLSPYKKGPAILAISSQAKIVPIVIHGAREVLPFGEWRIRPGKVEAVLCDAIPTDRLILEDREELVNGLRRIAGRNNWTISS